MIWHAFQKGGVEQYLDSVVTGGLRQTEAGQLNFFVYTRKANGAATSRPTQVPETGSTVAETRSLTPPPPETTQAAPSQPSPTQRRSARVAETDPTPTQAVFDVDMDTAPPSAQPPSTARRVSSSIPGLGIS